MLDGHEFWEDDLSIVTGEQQVDHDVIVSHRDVTDAHLLALAERHNGRLVTFDSGITKLLGGRDAGLLVVLDAPGQ